MKPGDVQAVRREARAKMEDLTRELPADHVARRGMFDAPKESDPMTQKCLSIFGHKFRARYSEEWKWPGAQFEKLEVWGDAKDFQNYTRTYHYDVCERCGATVDRKVLP